MKDQGGQGKQIDGNGKTSGDVSTLLFLFYSYNSLNLELFLSYTIFKKLAISHNKLK